MTDDHAKSRFGRREFLRYAGYTGVALSTASLLAACKDAETAAGGGSGSAQASIPPIEQEPGGLQVFDWSGYGNGDYYPKEEKKYLWGQYAKATGDTPEFMLFENDDTAYTKVVAGARYDVTHPCGYRYKDWVDLGVMQPWDTSLIPNFSDLNPKLMPAGQFDGQQYFVPLDWGFIAPLVNPDHVDPSEESFGVLFDERYKGKIAWVDTLNMIVVAGYSSAIAEPVGHDRRGARRGPRLPRLEEGARALLLEPVLRLLARLQEGRGVGRLLVARHGRLRGRGRHELPVHGAEGGAHLLGVRARAVRRDTQNYHHAHEYVDSWASTEAAEFLLAYYYYGHTNTTADLSVVSDGVITALGLDDPTVLDEPHSHPEQHIPRRSVYQQYWSEVQAS